MHHQPADEVYVAAKAIQLGDSEVTPVLLGVRQRGSELRTAVQGIVALARVNLVPIHQRCGSARSGQSGPTLHVARRDRDLNDLALKWKPACRSQGAARESRDTSKKSAVFDYTTI